MLKHLKMILIAMSIIKFISLFVYKYTNSRQIHSSCTKLLLSPHLCVAKVAPLSRATSAMASKEHGLKLPIATERYHAAFFRASGIRLVSGWYRQSQIGSIEPIIHNDKFQEN